MKRALWIVTFAVSFTFTANAQTIADIARQERANRKNATKTTSAPITNERAAKAKGSEVSSAPAATPTPAPANVPGNRTPGKRTGGGLRLNPGKTPETNNGGAGEFDKARVDIRRAENQAAVAQLELNAANRDYLTRSYDPDGRGPAAVGAATAKLDASQKNLEAARAKFASLEEELRRAGGPPGWAR
jgi:hypothetical protein